MIPTCLYLRLPQRSKNCEIISFSEIVYLESDINYTKIHLTNGKVKVSPRTLGYFIIHYLNDTFLRIHRSYCVNKQYIESLDYPQNPEAVYLVGGKELAISRRRMLATKRELVMEIKAPK